MQKKILSFITDGNLFLIVRNNPQDPRHGGDFWFTVTGAVEKGEDDIAAVKREVKEETNLDVLDTFSLNWEWQYTTNGVECDEYNYLSFVKDTGVKLNFENIEYRWVSLKDLVKQIRWEDKDILKKVLEKGLKKEFFFKQLKIESDPSFTSCSKVRDAQ